MVTISSDTYNNVEFGGPLSTLTLQLYELFSADPLPSVVTIPNEQWQHFIHMLYEMNGQPDPNFIIENNIRIVEHESHPGKVILALSGGKDSTASLLRLIDEGKNVTAYFCRKANLSYPTEEVQATEIANLYNIPIVKDELQRKGKTDFVENPVKNLVFLARMVEWAVRNNCGVIQLGEYYDTGNDKVNVKFDMSDSIDFILAYEEAVQSIYPHISFDFMFESEATAMSYLIYKHKEVLPHIKSCLMPERYFVRQLTMITDRYNIDPLPNRCMSCWKCCMEYVYLVLWGVIPLNKNYLEKKVLPTFIKKMPEIDRDWSETEEFKKATTKDLLSHVVELDELQKYIKDPSTIELDIHHRITY